ncbi:MAG: hypothetical protein QOK00_1130 [Thermoleophilaceae bacterium]|nr:hypothetical protein [Thermoleophilaceae bacterium]
MSGAEASPAPSPRARELVKGAVDVHVHIAPDVVERRIDDVGLARRFEELGLAGFVLKSHYTSTAERAAVVRGVVPGIATLGAIVLNRAIGGMNPLAVEIAAREGARVVWMPTTDSRAERAHLAEQPPGANLPVWAKVQAEFSERGIESEPVEVVGEDGELEPETRVVLQVIAEHGMALATGHLGREEVFPVVAAALAAGVENVVVTHPDFPAQGFSVDEQLELAGMGAWVERCFTTPYTGKCSWEQWLEGTKAVGAERTILSSDLGQVKNPPVEDGLALMADRLLEAGFGEAEVRTMAVTNTRKLAGL